MNHLRAFLLVGALFWTAAAACTSKDSLLDDASGASGGAPTTGGAAGKGGSSPVAGKGGTAGEPSSGGSSAGRGGGAGMGASGGTGAAGDTGANGGSPGAGGGGTGNGSSVGGAGSGTGGTSAGAAGDPTGGGAGAEQCPPGEMWCPGCTPGTGQCGTVCSGVLCPPTCSEVSTLDECEARTDCHSVFRDPGTCGCGSNGCCAKFSFCADGDKADCQLKNVQCEAATPFCDKPAFVQSASGFCYEGCVDPKDCAEECAAPDDGSGCACYSDTDCESGKHCYGADCASHTPGACKTPPATGCFGDVDCPGQTCIGARPTPCGSTVAEKLGTCADEACAEGDCVGSAGAYCTCEDGTDCVAATGPTGSGMCRAVDGTCYTCKCASPDTPIATPAGERRIAELRPGDLVYSIDGDAIRAVPILRVNRTPVTNHHVLRVTFDSGRSIEMTAGHPLADGRPLSALQPGSDLPGGVVQSVTLVPYVYPATYDILPASTSGAYFASGVLVGSTLRTVSPTSAALPP